eukprot:284541_1
MKGTPLGDAHFSQEAKKILEINLRHPLIHDLKTRSKENPDDEKAKDAAIIVFETAAFESGFALDDAHSFVSRLQKNIASNLGVESTELVPEEEYDLSDPADEDEEEEEEVGEEGADATEEVAGEEPEKKEEEKSEEL